MNWTSSWRPIFRPTIHAGRAWGTEKIVRVFSAADGMQLYEIRKHTDWIYAAGSCGPTACSWPLPIAAEAWRSGRRRPGTNIRSRPCRRVDRSEFSR